MARLVLGREIVANILREGTPKPYIDAGMDLAWLTDRVSLKHVVVFPGQDKDAYAHILGHWQRHGVVPTTEMFRAGFPEVSYPLPDNDHAASELIELARGAIGQTEVVLALSDVQDLLGDNTYQPELAAERLEAAAKALRSNVIERGFDAEIAREVERMRVRDEAKRIYALENADEDEVNLFSELPEPTQTEYRIDRLLPRNGYVLISAQRKAGKSTLAGNLIRALVSNEPFLGEYRTDGYNIVALLDLEMSPNQHSMWLKDMGIFNHRRLYVDHMRGRAGTLARTLFDVEKRSKLVKQLQEKEVNVLIVDPLGPLLRALAIDENSADVGRVVDALISIKEEAHVGELVIVHHQGKDASKGGRGHSVLEDTPDAIWNLSVTSSGRKITAIGRDVDQTVLLDYDEETRALTGGSALEDETDEDAVYKVIVGNPGKSGNEIFEMTAGIGRPKVLATIKALHVSGRITNTGSDTRPKWDVLPARDSVSDQGGFR